jgi:hypothetical protein
VTPSPLIACALGAGNNEATPLLHYCVLGVSRLAVLRFAKHSEAAATYAFIKLTRKSSNAKHKRLTAFQLCFMFAAMLNPNLDDYGCRFGRLANPTETKNKRRSATCRRKQRSGFSCFPNDAYGLKQT